MRGQSRDCAARVEARHLGEVHPQTNLREQMHDDALVLLHRFALAVVVAVIVAVKGVWQITARTRRLRPRQLLAFLVENRL